MNDSKEQPAAIVSETQIPLVNGEIDSRDLFRFGRELRIRHQGDTYRLRLTNQNKLILTK